MIILSLSAGLVAGATTVVIYVLMGLLRKKKPLLESAASIFVGFPGVTLGINIFLRSLDAATCPVEGESRLYFAFSGMSLVWISIDSISRPFRRTASG